jgi:hypothetical protein
MLLASLVLLAADEDNGQASAEVHDFGDPLWYGVSWKG